MRKLAFLPLLALLVVSPLGCATKEYVDRQTGTLSERISKLEGKDVPTMERAATEAKEAAEKAAAAAKLSEEAAKKAEEAAKRAEAAAKRAETAAEKAAKAFELMQRK